MTPELPARSSRVGQKVLFPPEVFALVSEGKPELSAVLQPPPLFFHTESAAEAGQTDELCINQEIREVSGTGIFRPRVLGV